MQRIQSLEEKNDILEKKVKPSQNECFYSVEVSFVLVLIWSCQPDAFIQYFRMQIGAGKKLSGLGKNLSGRREKLICICNYTEKYCLFFFVFQPIGVFISWYCLFDPLFLSCMPFIHLARGVILYLPYWTCNKFIRYYAWKLVWPFYSNSSLKKIYVCMSKVSLLPINLNIITV